MEIVEIFYDKMKNIIFSGFHSNLLLFAVFMNGTLFALVNVGIQFWRV